MKTGHTDWKAFARRKITPPQALAQRLAELRAVQNTTVATLNGSFDLLHAGHLHILFEASKAADVLVVALNTDASVKRYKNPSRPIIPLEYRMEMVSAIAFVDWVTWFDEDDPRELLHLIRPDVHVNGAEYGKECVEASVVQEIGASLILVDRIPGLATSEIVAAIQTRW